MKINFIEILKIYLFRIFLLSGFALMLSGCGTNPVTQKTEFQLLSEAQEINLGAHHYIPSQQAAGGQFILDPGLTQYINDVGNKLVKVSDRPNLPFEFVIINESLPNAWALPGGKIGIHRGLLTELNNEDELAAVLSHEIVHAAARHTAGSFETRLLLMAGAAVVSVASKDSKYQSAIQLATAGGIGLLTLSFSRDKELEADRYGIKYMTAAGYNPYAAVSLQETFVRLSKNNDMHWLNKMLATHPPSQDRVDANREIAASYGKEKSSFLPQGNDNIYREKIAFITRARPIYAIYDAGRKSLEKDPEKALEAADKAIKLEPREALFYGLRGDALRNLQRFSEAEKAYDQAISRNKDYYAFYLYRGLTREKLASLDGSKNDLLESVKLLPTVLGHYTLANIERDAHHIDEAIKHYRLASDSDAEISQKAKIELARIEIPLHPEKYLDAKPEIDKAGNIIFRITNKSLVGVKNISITARAGHLQKSYTISNIISPNEDHVVILDRKTNENSKLSKFTLDNWYISVNAASVTN